MSQTAKLSVIVPALNAAKTIGETLRIAALAHPYEILVVDGGSSDRTRDIAVAAGAQVIVDVPRGRGTQLAAGAEEAEGEWLLFLHADTRLSGRWISAISGFVHGDGNEERAAVFRFALDDRAPQARRIERAVAWRARVLGLPFGDQGLLISRDFYERLGGFRPVPLMEDVDLVRRIGWRRLRVLDATAITSATRYRHDGWWLRPLRNLFCLALYFLGVPPRLIRKVYG